MLGGLGLQLRKVVGAALRDLVAAGVTSGAVRALLTGSLAKSRQDLRLGLELRLRRIAFYSAAGLAGLVGAAFLISALYQWLSSLWGGAAAAAAVGGALLLLAGLLVGVEKIWPDPRRARTPPPDPAAGAAAAWDNVLRDGKKLFGDLAKQDWIMLIVAFIAGLLMTNGGSGEKQPARDDPEKTRDDPEKSG